MHQKSTTLWITLLLNLSVITVITAAVIEGIDKETGELTLSEDQFTQLSSGTFKSIEVRKTAQHQYNALSPITDDGIPQPSIKCWKLFDQYISANLVTFQAWANRYCRPYQSCWTCPDLSFFVAFFVNPTRPCDTTTSQTYSSRIPVFEQ